MQGTACSNGDPTANRHPRLRMIEDTALAPPQEGTDAALVCWPSAKSALLNSASRLLSMLNLGQADSYLQLLVLLAYNLATDQRHVEILPVINPLR